MQSIWQQIWQGIVQDANGAVFGAVGPLLARLAVAAAMAALTLALARLAGRSVRRVIGEASGEAEFALLTGRLAHLGVSGLGAGLILSVLGVPWAALATFFGFFGLGLSASLADIIKSVIAGAYLLIERPYRLGYTLTVRGHEGVVEEMRLRTTYLRLKDGRTLIVPNSIMMTEAIVTAAPPPIA